MINDFTLLNIDLPRIDFSVSCSKGTYIRSLVDDFGKVLYKGAYLTELRRTQIGEFNVNDALTVDEFRKGILDETINT
jgi:tRNA pseudouridine55 synthase